MSNKKPFLIFVLVVFCTLTACNTVPPFTKRHQKALMAADVNDEKNSVIQCQNELDILKQLNSDSYPQVQQRFEQLIDHAATYAAIRSKIDPQMKGTIDALYKYKTDKLCDEIEQQVMNDLTQNVEKLP